MQRLLSFCLIFLYVIQIFATKSLIHHRPNATEVKNIIKEIWDLKDTLNDIVRPYIRITFTESQPNCIQMQCKVICFNLGLEDVETEIKKVEATNQYVCKTLEELQLYNLRFPNNIIPINFLGYYTDKVETLYIGNSNVTDFEDGAFGNGIFTQITLENLKLYCLRRGFFKNAKTIQSLTVIQQETPLTSVCDGFLYDVRYKIKYLSLQVGIPNIRNITASNIILSTLAYVDFSFNNFEGELQEDVFSKLTRVQHLDLSHSKITYLPNFIFYDMNLEYLDLSYNNLKTISTNNFGWSEFSSEFKLIANNNNWYCTCELKLEMERIYGKQAPIITCEGPAEFIGWSVFDDRLCEEYKIPLESTTLRTTKINEFTVATTVAPSYAPPIIKTTTTTTFSTQQIITTTPAPNSVIDVECKEQTNWERTFLKIRAAAMDFTISLAPKQSVDVVFSGVELLEDLYGLIWFSNVTKEYYKMEVNYNDYGFGCYGSISYWTTVERLIPAVSYTFCLVHRHQRTVSPFNCKSIHIPGNLGLRYNAWLTRDLRATGISLSVLGIVIFIFIGILAIFILLKNKPILLKGSKRVATPKGNSNEIVVLPKDRTLEEFRQKEEMLAKRNSKCILNLPQRRNSIESTDSYMNVNLYEELPAYFKIDPTLPPYDKSMSDEVENENDSNSNYLPTLSTNSSTANIVSYAEIPFRRKRTSTDPLPAIPNEEKSKGFQSNIQALNMLDSENDQFPAYFAFSYDSSV